MVKDRDQLTPDEPEDWATLQKNRGQGTGGSGYDRVAGEESPVNVRDEDFTDEVVPDPIED
jgi:hypothetical protein